MAGVFAEARTEVNWTLVAWIGGVWLGLCALFTWGWSVWMRGLRDDHEGALERAGLLDGSPDRDQL